MKDTIKNAMIDSTKNEKKQTSSAQYQKAYSFIERKIQEVKRLYVK